MQACLQEKLQILQAQIPTKPEAILTYFEADENKAGGTYRTVQGEIKRIDEYRRVIVLLEEERERGNDVPEIERRKEIPLEDLYGIEIMQRISFRGDKEEISSHTSKAKEENLPDGV